MKLNFKNCILLFTFGLLWLSPRFLFSQDTSEINQFNDKIKSAQNVDELYSIRYNIDKYVKRNNLTIEDQRKLNRSFIMLSAAFKSKNHFKNAADVYKDYLSNQETYLNNYNVYLQDSIKAAHKKISEKELAQIAQLDSEIIQLKKTREDVAGLKSKYYSLGSMAAIAIVVLFLIIFITRNRAIRLTTNQLNTNRSKLLEMNNVLLESKMRRGSNKFGSHVISENTEILEKMLETLSNPIEKKSHSKEYQALQKTITIYNGTKI